MSNDFIAQGLALNASSLNRHSSLLARLRSCARRGETSFIMDDAPVYTPVSWAATTAFAAGDVVASGGNAYSCLLGGTSGSTPISGKGIYISDGAVYWTYLGPRLPVGYANSLALVAGQRVYANGIDYVVVTGGTTAASGNGPSVYGSVTDGSVTFQSMGKQVLPLVTTSTTSTSGLVSRAPWNSANVTITQGNLVQDGANPRASIVSATTDGLAYSTSNRRGGGSMWTMTDAPLLDFRSFGGGPVTGFVDGVPVGAFKFPTNGFNVITLDFSGCPQPRQQRTFRFMAAYNAVVDGYWATNYDVFAPYNLFDPIKAVLIGDSFGEGTGTSHMGYSYSFGLGMALGIDDFRVSCLGGTGILRVNGSIVNYVNRWTQDVIAQKPDLVILQGSGNDASGGLVVSDVDAALTALILRVKNELPNAIMVTMGQWNNRGALTGNASQLNTDAAAIAAAHNSPFVDWSTYLTDGGFVGSPTGTGNSLYYCGTDGTHPTYAGHQLRKKRLRNDIANRWSLSDLRLR